MKTIFQTVFVLNLTCPGEVVPIIQDQLVHDQHQYL